METEEILTGFIILGLSAAAVALTAVVVTQFCLLCHSIQELGRDKRNSGMRRFFDRSHSPGEEYIKNFSAGLKEIDQFCQSLK